MERQVRQTLHGRLRQQLVGALKAEGTQLVIGQVPLTLALLSHPAFLLDSGRAPQQHSCLTAKMPMPNAASLDLLPHPSPPADVLP